MLGQLRHYTINSLASIISGKIPQNICYLSSNFDNAPINGQKLDLPVIGWKFSHGLLWPEVLDYLNFGPSVLVLFSESLWLYPKNSLTAAPM